MATQNENALPNGTVLKHGGTEYRIERYLGAGGFGITYLVSGSAKVSGNTVTSKYCIKEHFLSSDCERDHKTLRVTCSKPAKERVDDGKKDFLSEAKRLRDKIQHSHIVRVKDVFEAFDTAYYVMEFLDGKSLRNYIKKHGACGEDEAIALMLPIFRAIGYLHDQSITHLDIKPDNIMIVDNERGKLSPTLIDFGLSKHYDKKGNATSTVRVMATSDGYSPVEQYQGIDTFQPTADIYALAATFVYCITGNDPKKSADIRPGEIKQLLQGKVSESSLQALLNGMKPSQYERTQSVREFMTELCPNEDSENWDVETDNNITDPIFFRKRNVQSSFISKIKGLFAGRVKKPKLLDMPDASIVVDIKYPKGEAFSKRVYFCFGVCNTVFTYDGNEQVDDEDFFGGLNGDVRDFFMRSRLLEDNHWECEQMKNDCNGNISVGITFHYKDGHEYSRAAVGVNKSNKLYQVLHGLLNCKSIKGIVFEYDETHEPNEQLHIKTESIFLESTMLAVYNGMLTSINLDQWRQLNLTEKSKFHPYIVDILIDNQRIGLFVEERNKIAFKDVRSELVYYEKQLNPSGVVGYEKGECRLLTSDEMFLLESHFEKLQNTFGEWGIKGMSMPQWVMNNGYISSYPVITGLTPTSSNIRPYVKYFGTVMVYSSSVKQDAAQEENTLVECIHCGKILKIKNDSELNFKQFRCPNCNESLRIKEHSSVEDIIKIKCPFDEAILSVRYKPDIESKNVTCPICKHKYPFTLFTRILKSESTSNNFKVKSRFDLKVYSIWEFGQEKDYSGNPLQQDRLYPLYGKQSEEEQLFILCDGFGSEGNDDVASAIVCESMSKSILNCSNEQNGVFTMDDFSNALAIAYASLDKKFDAETETGTTLAFLKLHSKGATIAHIGNSRVYHIRPGENGNETQILYQTQDHTLVNDLIKIGELSKEDAKYHPEKDLLSRVMAPNMNRRPKADVYNTSDIKDGDYFFICTKGMLEQSDMEDGTTLRNVFSEMGGSDENKVEILKSVTERNRYNHSAFIVHILNVDV